MSEPPPVPENPYVGPLPFTETDPLFGRDVEKIELLNILIAERIVLLYSPSGAGKTSLIQAGLIPDLRKERFRPLPIIRVNREPETVISPNRYITSAIATLNTRRDGTAVYPPAELAGLTLDGYLTRLESAAPSGPGEVADPVVLIFDQFEEILTADPTDLAAKEAFFAEVGAALGPRHRWALFAMREEHVAALDPYMHLIPTRLATTFRLGLLGHPAAKEAIQRPAATQHVGFTSAAADSLIADLSALKHPDGTVQAGALPFVEPVQLQVVCRQFWGSLPWADLPSREGQPQIAVEHIARYAKVDDALAAYYADKVHDIAVDEGGDTPIALERQIREWIETNLITERGTRAQLRVGAEREQWLPTEVIAGLANAYLIRSEGRPDDRWYELAHDRLVQPVRENNAVWLRDNLEPVQRAARQWDATGRRRDALLRGTELRKARSWMDDSKQSLPAWEQTLLADFIDDSVREQRSLWLKAVAVVGAVLIASLWAWQIVAQRDADTREAQQRANENLSLWLASQAEAQEQAGTGDPALALLLANEALAAADTWEARETLLGALTDQPGLAAILGRLNASATAVAVSDNGAVAASAGCVADTFPCPASEIRVWSVADRMPLGTLSDPSSRVEVSSLAFSPDVGTLAAGTSGRGVVLWDTATRQPSGPPLEGADRSISSVAFNDDGAILAAGSTAGTIVSWDPATGQALGPPLTAHQGRVSALAFGQEEVLASGGSDGAVLVWQGATLLFRCAPDSGDCQAGAAETDGAETRTGVAEPLPSLAPPLQAKAILTVRFSADGRWLAAGVDDGTVSIWEVSTGRQRSQLPRQPAAVVGLGFSPEGEWLSVVTENRTTIRWDVEARRSVGETQRAGAFGVVAFAADGLTFVSGDASWDVLLWDLGRLFPFARSLRAAGEVNDVAITADGRTLAAGLGNGTLELWDVPTAHHADLSSGSGDAITAVAFSPDGRTIAATSAMAVIDRWDVNTGEALPRLSGDLTMLNALTFDPAGERLVAGGSAERGGAIRFWDAASGEEIDGIDPAIDSVLSVAISADGAMLAASGRDGVVQLWSLDDRAADPTNLADYASPANAVAFRGDGAVVAAGSGRGVVDLWDADSGAERPGVSAGSGRDILAVAFSPDGATLAAGASDGTTYLWDVATSLAVGTLPGHAGPVWGLSFAGDGTLVSGSQDETILLWSLNAESLRASACRLANRNLTAAEWRQYMPNQPFRRTCPGLPMDEPATATAEIAAGGKGLA